MYVNGDISSDKIPKQYDLAVHRNYIECDVIKIVCSLRAPTRAWKEYFDRQDRIIKAMRLWKSNKHLDDKFFKIVKKLDRQLTDVQSKIN